ncbi:MAG: hypothetical protein ABIH65_01505 [Nanoarchaeota archaeon]
MGLFGFGKKDNVLDLAERYKKQKEREEAEQSSSSVSSDAEVDETIDVSDSSHERRRKLAKRILDITTRLDDLSNQIYHIQQRIEVLERKLNVKIE